MVDRLLSREKCLSMHHAGDTKHVESGWRRAPKFLNLLHGEHVLQRPEFTSRVRRIRQQQQ